MLTTKEKPADRVDDPYLAEKMKKEAESIFLWAFKGLQRLVRQDFKFTESLRIKANREKYPDLERGEAASMTGVNIFHHDFLKKQRILPGRLSKSLICWKVQIFLMLVKIQIKLWNYCRNFFLQ